MLQMQARGNVRGGRRERSSGDEEDRTRRCARLPQSGHRGCLGQPKSWMRFASVLRDAIDGGEPQPRLARRPPGLRSPWLPEQPLPVAACHETDRPSWPTGSHPRERTPITLPAAKRVPIESIGAPRADSMSARVAWNPLRMPDIRLQVIYPGKPDYRSVLIFGGVHIRKVRYFPPYRKSNITAFGLST